MQSPVAPGGGALCAWATEAATRTAVMAKSGKDDCKGSMGNSLGVAFVSACDAKQPWQRRVTLSSSPFRRVMFWAAPADIPPLWDGMWKTRCLGCGNWRQSQCRHQHLDGVNGTGRLILVSGRVFLRRIPWARSCAVWSSRPFFGDFWRLEFIPSTRWCLGPARVPSMSLGEVRRCDCSKTER